MIPKWYYFYAGLIEVGPAYLWKQGYSRLMPDGATTYPWSPKRRAQTAAKKAGAKAVFYGSQASAQLAMDEDNGKEVE